MKNHYEVYVGNIGKVHEGTNKKHALKIYAEYCKTSKAAYGRAAGEDVFMFCNNELIKETAGYLAE